MSKLRSIRIPFEIILLFIFLLFGVIVAVRHGSFDTRSRAQTQSPLCPISCTEGCFAGSTACICPSYCASGCLAGSGQCLFVPPPQPPPPPPPPPPSVTQPICPTSCSYGCIFDTNNLDGNGNFQCIPGIPCYIPNKDKTVCLYTTTPQVSCLNQGGSFNINECSGKLDPFVNCYAKNTNNNTCTVTYSVKKSQCSGSNQYLTQDMCQSNLVFPSPSSLPSPRPSPSPLPSVVPSPSASPSPFRVPSSSPTVVSPSFDPFAQISPVPIVTGRPFASALVGEVPPRVAAPRPNILVLLFKGIIEFLFNVILLIFS